MYSPASTERSPSYSQSPSYSYQPAGSYSSNSRGEDYQVPARENYRVRQPVFPAQDRPSVEDKTDFSPAWSKTRNTKPELSKPRHTGHSGDLSTRMHRPLGRQREKTESYVLPSPQTYQTPPPFQSNRRVFSQSLANNEVQEDFIYDENTGAGTPDYLQALKDFSNNKVDKLTIVGASNKAPQYNVYQRNPSYKIKSETKSKDFPFPYQRPVFSEPHWEYEREPAEKEEILRKPNTYVDIEESTRILSEPRPSKYNIKSPSPSPPPSPPPSPSPSPSPTPGYREQRRRGMRRTEAGDSLGGESLHHGGVTHHHHQGGLEAAVQAGARHYSPEQYQDPQRLSFQIHGQQGPHSYRFGHDTGLG